MGRAVEMSEKGEAAVGVSTVDERTSGSGTSSVAYPDQSGSPGMTPEIIYERTRVKRIFNFMQIFFLSLTFMSGWETMALNLYSVFYNGGPQVLSWGVLLVIAGACAQSASMAEMSSIQPIAGAQYHWTHFLAPHRFRNFITWMQGWITWFAWVSTLAGIANTTVAMLEGVVILNYPSFSFLPWHTTLINPSSVSLACKIENTIFALLAFQGIMNTYFFWMIPWLELLSGALHVTLYVIFMAVLLSLSKHHTASFVFFDRVDSSKTSGWMNNFVTWNLGLLTPNWGFVGFDGAVHLSEEVKKANKAVPRVMFWTIALNGVLAYSFVLTILYSAGDISKALASPTYQPFLYIAQEVTGSVPAATAMGCGLLIISMSVNLACIASVSRLGWAWARDGGLPSYFAKVDAKHHVPVRAVWLSVVVVAALACLNIPTTVAFQAFIALATLALFCSYLVAISCMIYARLQEVNGPVQLGEWNLGRYGLYVNIFAVIYTIYIMIWLPFPNTLPVTANNLNWAGPIFGMVLIIAISLWYLRRIIGKPWQGPSQAIIKEVIHEE